jgi:hypothetical protein
MLVAVIVPVDKFVGALQSVVGFGESVADHAEWLVVVAIARTWN